MGTANLQDNMTTLAPELNLPPDHPLRQILDTIAAHPEVREPVLRVLLTEKFLALPEQVEGLTARVDTLTDRVDTLQTSFDDFRDETRAEFHAVNERIDETNLSMQEQFRAVNERIDETNRLLSENTRATRRVEGHVGRLRGISYEDTCRHEIVAVMDGWLEDPVIADREPINKRLREARHTDLITRNEYLDGLRPDIIACAGDDENLSGPLAVAEASVTFNRRDLETAARRAEVIARVLGVRTFAIVVTTHQWPDSLNEDARQLGVAVIFHEVPEFIETW